MKRKKLAALAIGAIILSSISFFSFKVEQTPQQQQEVVYTIKLPASKVASLNNIIQKSTAPYNEVAEVLSVINPQIQEQYAALVQHIQDSIANAQKDTIKAVKPKK